MTVSQNKESTNCVPPPKKKLHYGPARNFVGQNGYGMGLLKPGKTGCFSEHTGSCGCSSRAFLGQVPRFGTSTIWEWSNHGISRQSGNSATHQVRHSCDLCVVGRPLPRLYLPGFRALHVLKKMSFGGNELVWVKQCHKPSPSYHHLYRCYLYKPFPVMGGLWHCFTHISSPH